MFANILTRLAPRMSLAGYVPNNWHATEVHRIFEITLLVSTRTSISLETFVQKCSDARAKLINELIVDVVTMDIRPPAIIDGEGMCSLLLYLDPGYRACNDNRYLV